MGSEFLFLGGLLYRRHISGLPDGYYPLDNLPVYDQLPTYSKQLTVSYLDLI